MPNEFISRIHGVSIAGGEGRRLRPFTEDKPKALLPVGTEKKPMLEFTMKPWVNLGISNYTFCTGYMSELIEKYFGDGSKFGVSIEYSVEEGRLETGGALKNALDNKKLPKNKTLLIFYCDDFVKLNPKEFIKAHILGVKEYGFKATMIATDNFRSSFGLIESEEIDKNMKRVTEFKEKPLINKHANVGIYCLEPEVLDILNTHQPPFKFERVIIPKLVKRGWLMVYIIPWENWLPLNNDKDYGKTLEMSFNNFYSEVLKK